MNYLSTLISLISMNAHVLVFLASSLLHIVGINTPPMS